MNNQVIIGKTESSLIYWYDESMTIIVHEVTARWSWELAYNSLSQLNNIIRQHDKDICTIHWFKPNTTMIPHGNALQNIKRIMMDNPTNEKMIILVGSSHVLQTFLNVIKKGYALAGKLPKYHYVKTFDEALDIYKEQF